MYFDLFLLDRSCKERLKGERNLFTELPAYYPAKTNMLMFFHDSLVLPQNCQFTYCTGMCNLNKQRDHRAVEISTVDFIGILYSETNISRV